MSKALPVSPEEINFDADKLKCRAAQATAFRKIFDSMRLDHSNLSDDDCRKVYYEMVRSSREIAARAGYFEGEI